MKRAKQLGGPRQRIRRTLSEAVSYVFRKYASQMSASVEQNDALLRWLAK